MMLKPGRSCEKPGSRFRGLSPIAGFDRRSWERRCCCNWRIGQSSMSCDGRKLNLKITHRPGLVLLLQQKKNQTYYCEAVSSGRGKTSTGVAGERRSDRKNRARAQRTVGGYPEISMPTLILSATYNTDSKILRSAAQAAK